MKTALNNTVIVAIPVLLVGGTEMQTLHLIRVLIGNGYQVVVCCYYEYDETMVLSMESAGAKVVTMDLTRVDGLRFLLNELIRLFKELNPQIVHVQYVAPGFIPIIAARFAGIKNILATVHQPGRTHGWKARLILRTAARFCSIFLCVSRSAEKSWFGDSALFTPELYQNGRGHFTIYNAVDTAMIAKEARSEQVARLRSSLGLEDKRVVGYVGRLRWEKGPHFLIEAFAKVAQDIPDAVLLIVGNGPDRQVLEIRAKTLGIAENVIWLGQMHQDEVFRLYGIIDVIAMPSIFEGFGLTAAEAMAAGLPVVGSAVDGLAEIIIDQETGLLVPPQDANALAAALTALLASPERAFMMGSKGRQRVNTHFSLQKFSESTLAAYAAFQGGK